MVMELLSEPSDGESPGWKRRSNLTRDGQADETNRLSSGNVKKRKSDLECKVLFLDGLETTFYISRNSDAAELFDLVFAYIGLNEEKEYFGLEHTDTLKHWIDRTKPLRKQCSGALPYSFYLRVKFFPFDPQLLSDEFARYLFVLHLREHIQLGTLTCSDLAVAAELCALLLQSEFGDCDSNQHTPAFVSTFRFLPEDQQTEQFELAVLQQYYRLAHRNLTPAAAERIYLERVRAIPDYGVDVHHVKGKDKGDYSLGLTPTGILVYEGDTKIGLFLWPMIIKLEMKRQKLKLVVSEEDESTKKVIEHTFVFILVDARACKHLWKCAVEHHAFFRLTDPVKVPSKRQQFFRLKSRFYASFRTEYQLHQMNRFGSSSFRKRNTLASQSGRSNAQAGHDDASTISGDNRGGSNKTFRRTPSLRCTMRNSFAARQGQLQRPAAIPSTMLSSAAAGSQPTTYQPVLATQPITSAYHSMRYIHNSSHSPSLKVQHSTSVANNGTPAGPNQSQPLSKVTLHKMNSLRNPFSKSPSVNLGECVEYTV